MILESMFKQQIITHCSDASISKSDYQRNDDFDNSKRLNKLSLNSANKDESSNRPLKGKLNENSKSFKPRFLQNRNIGHK